MPAAWVRNSVQPVSEAGHEGAYGYLSWVCRQGVMDPNAILPADAYAARGALTYAEEEARGVFPDRRLGVHAQLANCLAARECRG